MRQGYVSCKNLAPEGASKNIILVFRCHRAERQKSASAGSVLTKPAFIDIIPKKEDLQIDNCHQYVLLLFCIYRFSHNTIMAILLFVMKYNLEC